jgi:hypothetical protein
VESFSQPQSQNRLTPETRQTKAAQGCVIDEHYIITGELALTGAVRSVIFRVFRLVRGLNGLDRHPNVGAGCLTMWSAGLQPAFRNCWIQHFTIASKTANLGELSRGRMPKSVTRRATDWPS